MDVRALLESTLVGLGYEFVDLELTRSGGFRLFIDKPEGITVDDCVLVSNHLTRLFMVENIDYDRLEVSSPGLDRPLKKEADFVRFTGQLAKVPPGNSARITCAGLTSWRLRPRTLDSMWCT